MPDWPVSKAVDLNSYSIDNLVNDRSMDATDTTINELAKVLGTLIQDIKTGSNIVGNITDLTIARGDLIIRGASGLTRLAKAAGAYLGWDANDVVAVDFPNSINDFRLTLESGVPVSTSDQIAKTTIYLTSYKGNTINFYDGRRGHNHHRPARWRG